MSSIHERLLEAPGLRVRFTFERDRYAHEIWLADEMRGWTPLLSSVEGSPLEDWPASPPLQSLHVDRSRTVAPVGLLVGMAGKCHWSASIELSAAASSVSFDIACRVASPLSPQLGSFYRLARPWSAGFSAGGVLICSRSQDARAGLEIAENLGPARIEVVDDGVRIVATTGSDVVPRTVRWGYRVTRLDGGTV